MFLARRRVVFNKTFIATFKPINGIGKTRRALFLKKLLCTRKTIIKNLPRNGISGLSSFIEKHFSTHKQVIALENQVLRENIRNGSYRGMRMLQGLPSRGQRTHTNHRTARMRKSIYLNMRKVQF